MNRLKREERVRNLDNYIEKKDNASQNRRSRGKRISPNGKERKGSPRSRKPRSLSPSPINITKNDVTVLRTIRLISKLFGRENYSDELYSSYSGQQESRQQELYNPPGHSSSNLPQVDWENISKIVTQFKTGPP